MNEERSRITGPITEDWLRAVDFKWHQLDRQDHKHWLLWLGDALVGPDGKRRMFSSNEDLGIEVTPAWWLNHKGERVGEPDAWNCWLRADTAGRYHRFIHIRYLREVGELIAMIEGLTGQTWDPDNNEYGSMVTPAHAEHIRNERARLDKAALFRRARWSETEKDDTRGRALPEHLEAHEASKDQAG